MKSLKERILIAKTKKEIDTLLVEFNTYEFVSTNTKTKVKKAVKTRLIQLNEESTTKSKKKSTKKTKTKKGE